MHKAGCVQEFCKVTKQRMIAEVKDQIARLQEESILFHLAHGTAYEKVKD